MSNNPYPQSSRANRNRREINIKIYSWITSLTQQRKGPRAHAHFNNKKLYDK